MRLPKFRSRVGPLDVRETLDNAGSGAAGMFAGLENVPRVHYVVCDIDEAAADKDGRAQDMYAPAEFVVDRPFLFGLLEESSATLLFLSLFARMPDPEA